MIWDSGVTLTKMVQFKELGASRRERLFQAQIRVEKACLLCVGLHAAFGCRALFLRCFTLGDFEGSQ